MIFRRKKEDLTIEEEKNSNIIRNSNSLILSNTIILIPIVYVIIEAINKLPSVRTLTIIFGLIIVGCILVSNFLTMLNNYLDDYTNRKKLLLVASLLSSSIYLLLFIFIMVIMIVL